MPIYIPVGTKIRLKRGKNFAEIIEHVKSFAPLPQFKIRDEKGKEGVIEYFDIDFSYFDEVGYPKQS